MTPSPVPDPAPPPAGSGNRVLIERRSKLVGGWQPYRAVDASDAAFWLDACENEDWNRYGHYAGEYRVAGSAA